MSEDNQPIEIEMSEERITALATAAIRVSQHAAGITRDMHRDNTARDFLQANVLLAAAAFHVKLSTVCDCTRCKAARSEVVDLIGDRAVTLLAAFAEQQAKGGH